MEGLGSGAWEIARWLGSAPGLRLSSAIHYPARLMQQSGEFDFFAEKGGGRAARGREGAGGGCPGPGLPVVSGSGSDSQGRASPSTAGRAWGAGRGRWAEVRTSDLCPPPPSPQPLRSASPSALRRRPHLRAPSLQGNWGSWAGQGRLAGAVRRDAGFSDTSSAEPQSPDRRELLQTVPRSLGRSFGRRGMSVLLHHESGFSIHSVGHPRRVTGALWLRPSDGDPDCPCLWACREHRRT